MRSRTLQITGDLCLLFLFVLAPFGIILLGYILHDAGVTLRTLAFDFAGAGAIAALVYLCFFAPPNVPEEGSDVG